MRFFIYGCFNSYVIRKNGLVKDIILIRLVKSNKVFFFIIFFEYE